jgi:pimeloyl-ACP methyl ester carboxylesterase
MGGAPAALNLRRPAGERAQPRGEARMNPIRRIRTPLLEIAYEAHGPADGPPVVLLHGFPYDPRGYDDVAPALAAKGCRVVAPFLRGYGETRFLSPQTMRSGQQAALARDLVDLMDALSLGRAALAGYDWGGRAACIVAALWAERVAGLVTGGGYNIQDIAGAAAPQPPESEHRLWYQYYFHTERGRAGLAANRRELAELLWRLWSPGWAFDAATYARTAASFDNPDFVEVVIHSYRHRYGYAPGDASLEPIERALAERPPIGVPTIALCGADDGVTPPPADDSDARRFTGRYERRLLAGIGHNIPQEAPEATVAAVLDVLRS